MQNFMSIDELDIDFEDNEVMAICGQNGSGKSSLLYAIAFLLTGYRKGESYRDYVKTGCDTAYLYLEASLKGAPLYCEAELLGNQKKGIMQPTKRKTIYKGVTYLNSDHNQFIKENELSYVESLLFMFQDSNKDIIDAKPSERAAMLKKLLKFEFTDIVDKLNQEQELKKIEKVEKGAILDELKTHTFETQKLAREIPPTMIAQWNGRVEEINNNLRKLEDIKGVSEDNINRTLNEIRINIRNTEQSIKKEEVGEKQILQLLETKNEELNKVSEENLTKELNELQEELKTHQSEYKLLRDEAEEISQTIKVEEYQKSELAKQIKISSKGVCHACGQAITQEHIDNLNTKLKEIEDQIEKSKQALENLHYDRNNTKEKELNAAITQQRNKIQLYKNSLAEVEYNKKRLETNRELSAERKKYLNELRNRENSTLEELQKYAKIAPIIKEKDELVAELGQLKEKIQKAQEEKIRNVERKKNNEIILKEKVQCEEKLNKLTAEINNLLLEINLSKSASTIFESSFPSFLVLQATQRLENYINEIVQKIFPYMKVKLQMQRSGVTFLYTAESSNDEWLPVAMASGAQKAVLSLAYKTSLARLYGLTCIMLDEVDASCTANNAEIIYKFVASLNCFQQLIFISHRPESIQAAKSVNPGVVVYTVDKGTYTLVEE